MKFDAKENLRVWKSETKHNVSIIKEIGKRKFKVFLTKPRTMPITIFMSDYLFRNELDTNWLRQFNRVSSSNPAMKPTDYDIEKFKLIKVYDIKEVIEEKEEQVKIFRRFNI